MKADNGKAKSEIKLLVNSRIEKHPPEIVELSDIVEKTSGRKLFW